MKKISKYILLSLIVLLINLTPTFAQEVNLQTLGNLVLEKEPNATSFYIIGKYAFTDQYVKRENLNTRDIMLSARSIKVNEEDDGEVKGKPVYDKMNIYTVSKYTDGWKFSNNLIGSPKPSNDITIDIKYIDYKEADKVYTVTFKDDENKELEKQYVIEGKHATSPEIKEKEGHDFVGWFKCNDDSCTDVKQNEFNLKTETINGNITLKAKWEIHKFNVTFDKDGGTGTIENQQVEYNKTASQPGAEPTKEGYDFKGWYKCLDDNCTNLEEEEFNFSTNITKDTKLKAKWEIKKFTVTFDKDNNSPLVTEQVPYERFANRPHPDPTKEYYKFLGWFKCTNDECSTLEETEYNFSTPVKEDIKLKAKWQEIKYTITISGKIDDKADNKFITNSSIVVEKPDYKLDKDKLPTTTQEGYTFIGYFDEKDQKIENIEEYKFSKDMTVTAKWETIKYDVTFDNYFETVKVAHGKTVADPGSPKKENYIFEYWYDSSVGESTKFEFTTKIVKDTNLKAKFRKKIDANTLINSTIDEIDKTNFDITFDNNNSITFDIKNITMNLVDVDETNIVNKIYEALHSDFEQISFNDKDKTTINANDSKPQIRTKILTALNDIAEKNGQQNLSILVGKEIEITLKTNSSACFGSLEELEKTYKVIFKSNYITVNSESTLNEALSNGGYSHITIADSFTVKNPVEINRKVEINGNNQTITINELEASNNNTIFKVGEAGDLTLSKLTLDNKSGQVLTDTNADNILHKGTGIIEVQAGGKLEISDLTFSKENYLLPTVQTTGEVTIKANGYTKVDNAKNIKRGKNYDELEDSNSSRYYKVSNHSKLFEIKFNKAYYKGLIRYCMYEERPMVPQLSEINEYRAGDTKVNKFQHKWIEENKSTQYTEDDNEGGLPLATKNTHYVAVYQEIDNPDIEVVKDLQNLQAALNGSKKIIYVTKRDGLPKEGEVVPAHETIDIGSLVINRPVEILSDETVTLNGTILVKADNVILENITLEGKYTEDNKNTNEKSLNKGKYHIIKLDNSNIKNFKLHDSTISNKDTDNVAYSAVYLPVDAIKAEITNNTFNTQNIYNTIEFGVNTKVGYFNGSEGSDYYKATKISDNIFLGKSKHNHINIYDTYNNALLYINYNKFEYADNAIRLSHTSDSTAKFNVYGNKYTNVGETSEYNGFMLLQSTKDDEKFGNYTIEIIGLYYGNLSNYLEREQITTIYTEENEQDTENKKRVAYYSNKDGSIIKYHSTSDDYYAKISIK